MSDNYTQDFINEVKGALNSGSSGGGSKLVMLTKAEFDALIAAGTDDHDVYYVITDMGGDDGILASLLAEADPDTFTAEVN